MDERSEKVRSGPLNGRLLFLRNRPWLRLVIALAIIWYVFGMLKATFPEQVAWVGAHVGETRNDYSSTP
jgi:hypothetical protein